MNHFSRREFLKFGTALPLALQSLDLVAATAPSTTVPPKRIIFICNSLGDYEPNFLPTRRGEFSTWPYLKEMGTRGKMTVFQNLFHHGMETSNRDSENPS